MASIRCLGESELGSFLPGKSRYICRERRPSVSGAGVHSVRVDMAFEVTRPLIDPFERAITYLRVSVTDRCDFRCVYCMAEDMVFLPKADVLTLEELDRMCSAFVARGVRKLRLTGGEPLVRRNIMWLFRRLSRHLETGALDARTVLETLAEKGVVEPGILTQFGGEDATVRLGESGMPTAKVARPSVSGPGAGGRFVEVGLLGKGGMGQVFEAEDPDLKRRVAVKSLLPKAASSSTLRQKFLAEAQITGQLEHPNIIPVHEMGRGADGEIYFSMKKVEGRVIAKGFTLDQWQTAVMEYTALDVSVPRCSLLGSLLTMNHRFGKLLVTAHDLSS